MKSAFLDVQKLFSIISYTFSRAHTLQYYTQMKYILFIDPTIMKYFKQYFICMRTHDVFSLDFYIYIPSNVFSFIRVILIIYLKGEEDEKQTTDSLPWEQIPIAWQYYGWTVCDEGTFSKLTKIRRDVYIILQCIKSDLIRILLQKIRQQDGIKRTRYCNIRNTYGLVIIYFITELSKQLDTIIIICAHIRRVYIRFLINLSLFFCRSTRKQEKKWNLHAIQILFEWLLFFLVSKQYPRVLMRKKMVIIMFLVLFLFYEYNKRIPKR